MQTTFTPQEDDFIEQNYLVMPIKTLAKAMNRSSCGVTGRLKLLKLVIPAAIIAQRKKESFFKPGQISFNKGLSQSEYMTPAGLEKTKATRFKKGAVAYNAKADGCISIRKDSSGISYKHIRISKGKWELLQRHIYTKTFGPIPENMLVVFKDGNQINCNPSNLMLLSMAENVIRNSIHHLPPELKEVIKVLNKVKKQIRKNGEK